MARVLHAWSLEIVDVSSTINIENANHYILHEPQRTQRRSGRKGPQQQVRLQQQRQQRLTAEDTEITEHNRKTNKRQNTFLKTLDPGDSASPHPMLWLGAVNLCCPSQFLCVLCFSASSAAHAVADGSCSPKLPFSVNSMPSVVNAVIKCL
jgi:hypothetical protein